MIFSWIKGENFKIAVSRTWDSPSRYHAKKRLNHRRQRWVSCFNPTHVHLWYRLESITNIDFCLWFIMVSVGINGAYFDILAAVKRTAIPHHATFLGWSLNGVDADSEKRLIA